MPRKKTVRARTLAIYNSSLQIRLAGATRLNKALMFNQGRLMRDRDALVQIIATHLATGGSLDVLHTAVVREGLGQELEYALRQLTPEAAS